MTSVAAPHWNWAKTHRFTTSTMHQPTSIDQLLDLTSGAAHQQQCVRCVGSRHSFTSIADGDVLLDLSALPTRFEVLPGGDGVAVHGAMTYTELASKLQPLDLAIANTASLPHLTIAGAIATATHGSGDRNGNLATSVRALEIATSTGEVRRLDRGELDFGAAPISLGAMGAVVAIELDVEPSFEIEQVVHDDLSWSCLLGAFDPIFAAAYSVSVFTDWRDHLQLWTKRRVDQPHIDHAALHDGTVATQPRHPVPGEDASGCTAQGPVGRWSDRLPHFRSDAIPSVGAEVQSEFFVDRALIIEAIERMRSIGASIADSLMISEIRTVRRDDLWLSPQYERDCVGFHFTWHHDVPAAEQAARQVAAALSELAPVPHWGKVFDRNQFDFDELYPKLAEARRVFQEWDPAGVFTNRWLRETIH